MHQDTPTRNQLQVAGNAAQATGQYPRALCICSAGCLRSPTMAYVLSQKPWYRNVRAVGTTTEYAIIPITPLLLVWADEIFCADALTHTTTCQFAVAKEVDLTTKDMYCLDIPDQYDFANPRLVLRIGLTLNKLQVPKNEHTIANPSKLTLQIDR